MMRWMRGRFAEFAGATAVAGGGFWGVVGNEVVGADTPGGRAGGVVVDVGVFGCVIFVGGEAAEYDGGIDEDGAGEGNKDEAFG